MKTFILAGAAIAIVATPSAFAAGKQASGTIILAQADGLDAIRAADQRLNAARDALRKAKESGEGVAEAQAEVEAAQAALAAARASARAKPPAPPEQPPAAAEAPPPKNEQPPPAAAEAQPPAKQDETPAQAEGPRKPPRQRPPANTAEQPPATPPPPAAKAEEPPPATPKPPAATAEQPPPPKAAPPAKAEAQPPAPAPRRQAEGGNPPPDQPFDPKMLKRPHPRFGDTPKAEPKVDLPKDEAAIPKGGEIKAGNGRVIVKDDRGDITIRHDDSDRFRRLGGNVDVQQGRNGTTTTTVQRPGGVEVVTVKDRDGNILQRYRKNRDGSIEMLIGAAGPQRGNRPPPPPAPPQRGPSVTFDFHNQLPPIRLRIPRDQYVVESSRATPQQLEQTFEAPPVEQVERPYTLEEIRRSDRLRSKVRRVDFDTVTFEFGSAVLPDDQIPQIQAVGEAMQAVLQNDPDQVFLIEGHTDAVGSDLANLALSDRRAETVAEILTYYFQIPPENLVTQGYGEQFLKVPTTGPERENRRVAFRNITQLMRVGSR